LDVDVVNEAGGVISRCPPEIETAGTGLIVAIRPAIIESISSPVTA
jgi:hypothetical protein